MAQSSISLSDATSTMTDERTHLPRRSASPPSDGRATSSDSNDATQASCARNVNLPSLTDDASPTSTLPRQASAMSHSRTNTLRVASRHSSHSYYYHQAVNLHCKHQIMRTMVRAVMSRGQDLMKASRERVTLVAAHFKDRVGHIEVSI